MSDDEQQELIDKAWTITEEEGYKPELLDFRSTPMFDSLDEVQIYFDELKETLEANNRLLLCILQLAHKE